MDNLNTIENVARSLFRVLGRLKERCKSPRPSFLQELPPELNLTFRHRDHLGAHGKLKSEKECE